MMYSHAYQSYLWNSVVSERVRLFGCDRPVVGDLVLVDLTSTGDDVTENGTEDTVDDDGKSFSSMSQVVDGR